MVVVTVLAPLVIALAMGAAGDFVAWIVGGAGTGAWVASLVCVFARRRARRRLASPWTDTPPLPTDLYLEVGGIVGGGIGIALAIVDAWPLI